MKFALVCFDLREESFWGVWFFCLCLWFLRFFESFGLLFVSLFFFSSNGKLLQSAGSGSRRMGCGWESCGWSSSLEVC